jgi:hypothetical protein
MVSVILSKKCICTYVLFGTVSDIELFRCTVHCTLYNKQHTMSSHELHSALKMTVETHDQYFLFSTEYFRFVSLCSILSGERMGLSFTITAEIFLSLML